MIRYNSIDEVKRDIRACKSVEQSYNSLHITPPKHSTKSPPELIITEKGGSYLVNYLGGKYLNKEEALLSCGLEPDKLYKTPSGYIRDEITKPTKSKPKSKNPIQYREPDGTKRHTKVKTLLEKGYEILKPSEELCEAYGWASGKFFNSVQLKKFSDVVKFAKQGDKLLLLWNTRENLINPNNKNTVLIAEGFTNSLALLSSSIYQYYAIGIRFNLTTLPVFKEPFKNYIFIRDADETNDHLKERINKYYSGIKANFFTLSSEVYEPESDLDIYLMNNSNTQFIERVRANMKGVSNE